LRHTWLILIAFFVPFVFVTVHSVKSFGWRDTVIPLAIMMVVGFTFEAIGTNTGFPFGKYFYPEAVNGPLVLGVPPLLPMVYAAMGYVCYWLARLLLAHSGRIRSGDVLSVAGIAAMLMVLWDLAFDPTQSTVLHHYIWTDGGPYFGVPFTNFTGWFLNTFVFFLLVGGYFSRISQSGGVMPPRLLLPPIAFYLAAIIGLAAPFLLRGDTAAITQSMTLIAVFAMGVPGLVALSVALRLR
jgi:uncharacterized membrane protein